MVRSTFPAMFYNDYTSVFEGKIDVGIILTMNVNEESYPSFYSKKMEKYFAPYRFLNGHTTILTSCDTLQVDDYSRYEMKSFNEEHKKEHHAKQFPFDLKKAYDLGYQLCR